MVSRLNNSQGLNSGERVSTPAESNQISLAIEPITLDIPNADILSQAFDRVRTLPNYLKPIVMEGIARKLGVTKKTLDKSYEAWMMERIERISQLPDVQGNQNGEEG